MDVQQTTLTSEYFLSIAELGELLGITVQGVHQLIKRHKLESEKIGSQKYLLPQTVRQILEGRGVTYKPQIISIQANKGGVGKTTTAYHIAIRASMYGARVLCVDLDMQGNMTQAFQVKDPNVPVFYDVFKDEIKIEDAIIPVSQHISILGSHLANSRLDKALSQDTKLNPATVIRNQLEPIISKYDLVIIDCSPALSHLNTCVALASDMVIIPVNPDPFAVEGLTQTMEELTEIKKRFESDFSIKIVFNKYDAREKSSFDYLTSLSEQYKGLFFKSFIRNNADLKNAIIAKKSVFDYKQAPAREDYDLLTKEILAFPDLKQSETSVEPKRVPAAVNSERTSAEVSANA